MVIIKQPIFLISALFFVPLSGMENPEPILNEALKIQECTWPIRRQIEMHTKDIHTLMEKCAGKKIESPHSTCCAKHSTFAADAQEHLHSIKHHLDRIILECDKIRAHHGNYQEHFGRARLLLWQAYEKAEKYSQVHHALKEKFTR
jgi:hypothetical protein